MINKEVSQFVQGLTDNILGGELLTEDEAISLGENISSSHLANLFEASNRVREAFCGKSIKLCAIINAKSGQCGENCIFCAQSRHYRTGVAIYPLLNTEQIMGRVAQAKDMGVHCFSLVASGGKTENKREIDRLSEIIHKIRTGFPSISCAASLGAISFKTLVYLKEAGLQRFHHNLETSESFFPKVCTSLSFRQRKETIEAAKEAGLLVCSGGIFGLGESVNQRLELAFTLRKLAVDFIPLNFLYPVKGTRCQDFKLMAPLEALKTIAFFRFIIPYASLQICGGRQTTLRSLQSWIFMAGANGLMVGNYLTTQGAPWEGDKAMIEDLGFNL